MKNRGSLIKGECSKNIRKGMMYCLVRVHGNEKERLCYMREQKKKKRKKENAF